MADTDIVILNPQATNEAIERFEAVKGKLGEVGSEIQANSKKLKAAWIADASEDYYSKTKKLIENITTVQSLLEKQILDIDTRTTKEKQANITAKELSESVNAIDLK